MPESRNTSLLELAGRFEIGGAESVVQRFPTIKHFLIIPPQGESPPPVVWSSHSAISLGTTALCQADRKYIDYYANPSTVVSPIEKTAQNDVTDVIVGRGDAADIKFKDKGVSKKHARIKLAEDKILIRDLESTNGTFINRTRLLPDSLYQVTTGQEVSFADIKTLYLDLEQLLELIKMTTER